MNYIVEENITNTVSDYSIDYASDEINNLTYKIIGAAMEVYNTIGRGFLESVYKDCLTIEFDKRKLGFQREKKFNVIYKGIKIPHSYNADFIIEDQIIVEIKAQSLIIEENIKQTINY